MVFYRTTSTIPFFNNETSILYWHLRITMRLPNCFLKRLRPLKKRHLPVKTCYYNKICGEASRLFLSFSNKNKLTQRQENILYLFPFSNMLCVQHQCTRIGCSSWWPKKLGVVAFWSQYWQWKTEHSFQRYLSLQPRKRSFYALFSKIRYTFLSAESNYDHDAWDHNLVLLYF